MLGVTFKTSLMIESMSRLTLDITGEPIKSTMNCSRKPPLKIYRLAFSSISTEKCNRSRKGFAVGSTLMERVE